jgi:S-DNA-T family DNA segregation ATPase FtsK/SpoIIIE
MPLRDILDKQATTIEYVLHTHGIRAQVDGGRLSPRLAHFHIILPPGVRAGVLSPLVDEISEALGVIACRLTIDGDESGVYLEVPRPDPIPVRMLPLVQRVSDVVPPNTATLGMGNEGTGTPLLLRLNAPEVNPVLVSGEEGAGKSRLLRGMAISLALHNSPNRLRLLLIDASGDGIAFRGMEDLPHLACPIANGPIESLVSLRWAMRTMTRRDTARMDEEDSGELFFDDDAQKGRSRSTQPTETTEPELVILIDGVESLLSGVNRRMGAATEAVNAITRLLASGDQAGVYTVVTSEHPDLNLNVEWGARITGPVASPEEARIATGMKGSGAQSLLGQGDFLISLTTELIRFQAAHISSNEVEKCVKLINNWLSIAPESIGEVEEASTPPAGTIARKDRTHEEPVPLRRSWMGS